MKSKGTIVLVTVATLATLLSLAGLAGANPLVRPNLQGGAPTVVSYQGQVKVDGAAYDGTGYFKFAIVNAAGDTTYWSNDGTASGEPTNAVSLTVSNSLFNVLLGDTSLTNMTALSADVFNGTERYLRVWFSTTGGAGSFTWLDPDRRIAAVPYALQAEEAKNADLLDGQHGSYYQTRVSGACAVGSTVRAINADGSVTCQADAPLNRLSLPTTTIRTPLDSGGDVGSFTSITIGADGLGLISYRDFTDRDLKVAHCSNVNCDSATITTLDSGGWVGRYSSITIGADGLGLISYQDFSNRDLKVAHCNDLACTSAISTTLDSGGSVGWDTSITIGADGLGLISYRDDTNDALKVAHCSNVNCTSATITPLDSAGDVGHSSITIGADGLGLISYYDWSNGDLKVAHCSNPFCIPYFRRR